MTDVTKHEPKMCATCLKPLDFWSSELGQGQYVHASQVFRREEDHVPIPIDIDEVTMSVTCDFCRLSPLDERQFTVVTVPFVSSIETSPGVIHSINMSALWAACPDCAGLISGYDWDGLLQRSVEMHDQLDPPRSDLEDRWRKAMLQQLYEMVRVNLQTVRPAKPDDWNERDFAPDPRK